MKTARHRSMDEVQYGDDPSQRSPASNHLIEVLTGGPSSQRQSNGELETKELDLKGITNTDTARVAMEILENSSKPYTAATAAKLRMSVSKITTGHVGSALSFGIIRFIRQQVLFYHPSYSSDWWRSSDNGISSTASSGHCG